MTFPHRCGFISPMTSCIMDLNTGTVIRDLLVGFLCDYDEDIHMSMKMMYDYDDDV